MFIWSKFKAFADNKINVAKMMISCLTMQKTLWEKEKMLVTSIFSFSHNIFRSLIYQGISNLGLCDKGLKVKIDHKTLNSNFKIVSCHAARILGISLSFTIQSPPLRPRNKQFLLFPQCFLPRWRTFCHFNHI